MTISEMLSAAVGKPVATAARAARQALERIAPAKEAMTPPRTARKSKGWRKHLRAAKAQQRG
jgi:hypothetical protein